MFSIKSYIQVDSSQNIKDLYNEIIKQSDSGINVDLPIVVKNVLTNWGSFFANNSDPSSMDYYADLVEKKILSDLIYYYNEKGQPEYPFLSKSSVFTKLFPIIKPYFIQYVKELDKKLEIIIEDSNKYQEDIFRSKYPWNEFVLLFKSCDHSLNSKQAMEFLTILLENAPNFVHLAKTNNSYIFNNAFNNEVFEKNNNSLFDFFGIPVAYLDRKHKNLLCVYSILKNDKNTDYNSLENVSEIVLQELFKIMVSNNDLQAISSFNETTWSIIKKINLSEQINIYISSPSIEMTKILMSKGIKYSSYHTVATMVEPFQSFETTKCIIKEILKKQDRCEVELILKSLFKTIYINENDDKDKKQNVLNIVDKYVKLLKELNYPFEMHDVLFNTIGNSDELSIAEVLVKNDVPIKHGGEFLSSIFSDSKYITKLRKLKKIGIDFLNDPNLIADLLYSHNSTSKYENYLLPLKKEIYNPNVSDSFYEIYNDEILLQELDQPGNPLILWIAIHNSYVANSIVKNKNHYNMLTQNSNGKNLMMYLLKDGGPPNKEKTMVLESLLSTKYIDNVKDKKDNNILHYALSGEIGYELLLDYLSTGKTSLKCNNDEQLLLEKNVLGNTPLDIFKKKIEDVDFEKHTSGNNLTICINKFIHLVEYCDQALFYKIKDNDAIMILNEMNIIAEKIKVLSSDNRYRVSFPKDNFLKKLDILKIHTENFEIISLEIKNLKNKNNKVKI